MRILIYTERTLQKFVYLSLHGHAYEQSYVYELIIITTFIKSLKLYRQTFVSILYLSSMANVFKTPGLTKKDKGETVSFCLTAVYNFVFM